MSRNTFTKIITVSLVIAIGLTIGLAGLGIRNASHFPGQTARSITKFSTGFLPSEPRGPIYFSGSCDSYIFFDKLFVHGAHVAIVDRDSIPDINFGLLHGFKSQGTGWRTLPLTDGERRSLNRKAVQIARMIRDGAGLAAHEGLDGLSRHTRERNVGVVVPVGPDEQIIGVRIEHTRIGYPIRFVDVGDFYIDGIDSATGLPREISVPDVRFRVLGFLGNTVIMMAPLCGLFFFICMARAKYRLLQGRCRFCGYDNRHGRSSVCTECGRS